MPKNICYVKICKYIKSGWSLCYEVPKEAGGVNPGGGGGMVGCTPHLKFDFSVIYPLRYARLTNLSIWLMYLV